MTKKSLKKKNKPVTKFTIDRAKWLNGELQNRYLAAGDDAPHSTLLHETGPMCCLGFYAKECGVPKAVIAQHTDPSQFASKRYTDKCSAKIVSWDSDYGVAVGGPLMQDLINANDDYEIPVAKREKRIISLFKKAGIECKIIGKYPVIK